jgi:trk system potassium uptake protein TrkA
MPGRFAVIGMGQFGKAVVRNLAERGQSVLAIDNHQDELDLVEEIVDSAVCADTTDETVLQDLQLARMTCVVVAIGAASMESSILTTALLKQLGVPRIVARSISDLHSRVLRAVGAHETINPEDEMGTRLARRLAEPNVLEQFDLGDAAQIAEIEAPQKFVGRTLVEIDVRNRYGVSVVAIKRQESVIANPAASTVLKTGDILVLLGGAPSIRALAALA